MTLFYLLLLVIAALPVAIVLPSLLRKNHQKPENTDQLNIEITKSRIDEVQQHLENNQDRRIAEQELQATLLDDLRGQGTGGKTATVPAVWNMALLLMIPVASLIIYAWIGNPQLADTRNSLMADNPIPGEAPDIHTLLDQLEKRIAEDPENPKGWELAATTYMRLGNYARAENAYRELNRLVVGNPDLLTAWADASILHTGNYTPGARKQIEKALSIDPFHANALWIAGLGARNLGNHAEALNYFNRLKPLLKDNQDSIDRVNELIKGSAAASAPATVSEEDSNSSVKLMIDKEIIE